MPRKLTLIVAFIIFIFAFFINYSFYNDFYQEDVLNGYPVEKLFTSKIGSGSDPEAQLTCATGLIKGTDTTFMTHYDYLFMCPYISLLIKTFGFTNGMQALAFTTIFIGSIVAVVPFLLFTYLKKFSLGGLIASIILATNQIIVFSSSGRLVIYNLTMLTFTAFYICFFMAIYRRKTIWLVLLGLAALIQGLNKPFLLVNDIPFLFVFIFIYLTKKFALKKEFPFFSITFNFSKRQLMESLIPIFILLVGSIAYEFIHFAIFKAPSYLGDTFVLKTPGVLNEQELSASLLYKGPIITKFKNIVSLLIVGLSRLLKTSQIPPILFLLGIFIAGIQKKKPIKFFIILGI